MDITHVERNRFLSVIDTKSKYSIWIKLNSESGKEVASCMNFVFAQFGPPEELLSDNGTAFRSHEVKFLLQKWEVNQRLSCAYRAPGNGIAERSHRTIKRILARSVGTVDDAVFWKNNT